jgi:hypothetical protein
MREDEKCPFCDGDHWQTGEPDPYDCLTEQVSVLHRKIAQVTQEAFAINAGLEFSLGQVRQQRDAFQDLLDAAYTEYNDGTESLTYNTQNRIGLAAQARKL